MRIGILTKHHSINWGSVLQAYALQKWIEKFYPKATVEIINYQPEVSRRFIGSSSRSSRKLWRLKYSVRNRLFEKKWSACEAFLRTRCRLSEGKLVTDDSRLAMDYISRRRYDRIFVGSDTVFQLGPNYGSTYVSVPPPPNAYFLPGECGAVKIGFAVSVNPFRKELLDAVDRNEVSQCLRGFDAIYFRDSVTEQALGALGLEPSATGFMPDPTLLVDFDLVATDVYGEYESNDRLVGVALGNEVLSRTVCALLVRAGYTPVQLLGETGCRGRQSLAIAETVEQFVALHACLRFMITDRFHGSILSLVVGKCPVIGIEERNRYPEKNSKIRDLFVRFQMEDMICRYEEQSLDQAWLEAMLSRWRHDPLTINSRIGEFRDTARRNMASIANISRRVNYT